MSCALCALHNECACGRVGVWACGRVRSEMAHVVLEKSEEVLKSGLDATAKIYDLTKNALDRPEGVCTRAELKKIKKAAAKANALVMQLARQFQNELIRTEVELAMLKHDLNNDSVDVAANKAALFDTLRKQRTQNATTDISTSLYGPTSSQLVVDRSIGVVSRIEASIHALSAIGPRSTHGAQQCLNYGDRDFRRSL